uniref:zinc finger BED domain-containing protein 4-like n=1 Tax=Ciona intestinalis TaxID=7719 RepID=UPI000180B01A|nr:zinc finger BED domain-containing protein 4-like [Ciona intestinalis]|eukprot:XP_002125943.3 zinc finger BED domain-containing protein 4-like [Ciona intestinalis]
MLRRMLEQKHALSIYASEYGHFSLPNTYEWELVAKLVALLTPFETITLEISHSEASASCILPSIAVLKALLQSDNEATFGIGTIKGTMCESLLRRYCNVENVKPVVIACLLDPRFKDKPFSSEIVLGRAKDWLINEVKEQDQGEEPVAAKKQKQSSDSENDLLSNLYKNVLGQGSTDNNECESTDVQTEINKYLSEPLIDRSTGHPLDWWKNNETRFVILAKLARKYLNPPPSSVPSERDFSTIGNIYEDKRSRLTGEHAEQLCFLYYNLHLLEYNY